MVYNFPWIPGCLHSPEIIFNSDPGADGHMVVSARTSRTGRLAIEPAPALGTVEPFLCVSHLLGCGAVSHLLIPAFNLCPELGVLLLQTARHVHKIGQGDGAPAYLGIQVAGGTDAVL